jgi:hypothetical protein
VKNLKVTNSAFSNTNGTAPQSGINFEPEDCCEGITLENVDCCNNTGIGVQFLGVSICIKNIKISGSQFYNNYGGLYMDNCDGITVSSTSLYGTTTTACICPGTYRTLPSPASS